MAGRCLCGKSNDSGGVAALMSISLSSIQHFIDDSLAALPDDFPLPDSHSKELALADGYA